MQGPRLVGEQGSASRLEGQPPGGGARGDRGGRGGRGRRGGRVQGAPDPSRGMENGCYHCQNFKRTGKCDLCKHILERREFLSSNFRVKHVIAGHNIHPPASQAIKMEWFIYMEGCVHPEGVYQYKGSTTSMTERWANTKSVINNRRKAGTGLETHYLQGCSHHLGPDLGSVRVTLLEHMITNHDKLTSDNHKPGPGCRCSVKRP